MDILLKSNNNARSFYAREEFIETVDHDERLVIGWRGRPGVHDEPQHVKQGKVTTGLLNTIQSVQFK